MSSAVVFVLVCCVNAKKTLHKARLTALHGVAIETIEKGENIAEFTHW